MSKSVTENVAQLWCLPKKTAEEVAEQIVTSLKQRAFIPRVDNETWLRLEISDALRDYTAAAVAEENKRCLVELRDRLQEIMPPGAKIGRAEILAMIDDRIAFPRAIAARRKDGGK